MNGILFTPANHHATRDLLKTETRRLSGLEVVNQEPDAWETVHWRHPLTDRIAKGSVLFEHDNGDRLACKPRYHVGETVFIREAHYAYGYWEWAHGEDDDDVQFIRDCTKPIYFPDTKPQDLLVNKGHLFGHEGWYKRSPLFLKAIHARDYLKILDVFPQRLQEITEEGAIAEGTPINDFLPINTARIAGITTVDYYADLWDSINPKFPWSFNPWVFVYKYKLIKKDGA